MKKLGAPFRFGSGGTKSLPSLRVKLSTYRALKSISEKKRMTIAELRRIALEEKYDIQGVSK